MSEPSPNRLIQDVKKDSRAARLKSRFQNIATCSDGVRSRKKRHLTVNDTQASPQPQSQFSSKDLSSAVLLWFRRLKEAEPYVEQRPGIKMLQHYGAAFRVVDNHRLVFKEWRAGAESADRPACESCYEHDNIATVATSCLPESEWPTKCARHATQTDRTVTVQAERPTRETTLTRGHKQQKNTSRLQTSTTDKFTCAECHKRFAKRDDLKRHLRTHTGEKPFACTECDSRFAEASALKRHLRTHTGEKPYACTECDSCFAEAGTLQKHMRTHTGEKPYACTECDSRFARSGDLKRHIRMHTGEKPYVCTECDSRFTEAGHLKIHMRMHTGEKPFECTDCGYCCTTSGALKEHLRTHTGEKPFACPECDSCFTTSSNLKTHLRTHTGEKPFACTECDSRFTTSDALKVHMRKHTGEKPFACTECGVCFATSSKLAKHKRVHTGEKPYQCIECGVCFTETGALKVHMRTHTGKKPFACTECNYCCTNSSNLQTHMRRHEESKKWQHVCEFASFSTAKYDGTHGTVRCTTRCPTERSLDDHVQRCHTAEGIAKRFKSEQQLAEFLAAKGWAFDRDFANAIFYKHCDKQITPRFVGTVSARPDFHLLKFQSLPAGRRCLLLLCNDEFAHRRYRCELGRMLQINTALAANENFRDLPIVYIRFNPHWFEVDNVLHDPKLQSRFERLQRLLTDLQEGCVPEVAGRPGLSLIYLYYDRQTAPEPAEPWRRLAGGLYEAGPDTADGNSEVALALRDCVVLVE